MKDVFSAAGLRALEELAASAVLLAFDYDGTLAPIVQDPEEARMRPRTRGLLAELSKRYPCAVVSGRARGDVLRFVRGIALVSVVGNHGVEWAGSVRRTPQEIRRWRTLLEDAVRGLTGVRIEDKRLSISVHYRAAADKEAARAAVLSAVGTLSGARVLAGKDVLSVVHPAHPNKGDALLAICRRVACQSAIYAGDDETDEDVFALSRPGQFLSIRVGRRRGSRAEFVLRGQQDIDELLARLLELRPGASLRRRAP